jgi:hypothetical protein
MGSASYFVPMVVVSVLRSPCNLLTAVQGMSVVEFVLLFYVLRTPQWAEALLFDIWRALCVSIPSTVKISCSGCVLLVLHVLPRRVGRALRELPETVKRVSTGSLQQYRVL